MSSENKIVVLDRDALNFWMKKVYGSRKNFCKKLKINKASFDSYMRGIDKMPAITQKIVKAIDKSGYSVNRINELKNLAKKPAEVSPDIKLKVAGGEFNN